MGLALKSKLNGERENDIITYALVFCLFQYLKHWGQRLKRVMSRGLRLMKTSEREVDGLIKGRKRSSLLETRLLSGMGHHDSKRERITCHHILSICPLLPNWQWVIISLPLYSNYMLYSFLFLFYQIIIHETHYQGQWDIFLLYSV